MEEAIMMDSAVFSQFSEHLKEAYGEKEHRGLAGVAANNAGAGKIQGKGARHRNAVQRNAPRALLLAWTKPRISGAGLCT